MTREEYVALNKELMHDKISLEGDLKHLQAEIKKNEQKPDKKEEVTKLKKEEDKIKKELALVKQKMTKNYEAKKEAEKKTITNKAVDYGKDLIEKAKEYGKYYQIGRNVSKAVMEGASVYKGAPDIHLKPQVVVENIQQEKKIEEKMVEKLAKLKVEELKNKPQKKNENQNESEKKQQEIDRQKRIEEFMKNKEMTKGKTL